MEPVDLASANEADFQRIVLTHSGQADHSVAMIIHNAGTIGQATLLASLWKGNRFVIIIDRQPF